MAATSSPTDKKNREFGTVDQVRINSVGHMYTAKGYNRIDGRLEVACHVTKPVLRINDVITSLSKSKPLVINGRISISNEDSELHIEI